MPKYRSLTFDELQSMEKDFVEYLVLNGITADEWQKILTEEKEKADKITSLFSDVVFEKILRKVDYILVQNKKEVLAFHCKATSMKMIGLTASKVPEADLTNADFIQHTLQNPSAGFEIINGEKPYTKQRELEIFDLTKKGGLISDGKMYAALSKAL